MVGLWQLFCILCLILSIIALYQLVNSKNMDVIIRWIWAVFILFVPLIGSTLFFVWKKRMLRNT